MAKGYPVLFSLCSWITGDVAFNSVFMISFKSHPIRSLLPMVLEGVSEELLSFVVRLNIFLITL
jgi:hypothetical protein